MSLWSLMTILLNIPLYYSTIMTSTFATVSTNIPSYEAIHGYMPLHRVRVSLDFSYNGGRYIRKEQWCANVNILQLTVGYVNATITKTPRNTELELGTDGSCQTWQNPQVDGYGSGFGPARTCRSGFWTVLEPNRTVFPVRTRTCC
jgi:hypothetical protein